MEEEDERTVELSSIEAIFPEFQIDRDDPYTGAIDVAVTPDKPLKIYFQASTEALPPALLTPPTSAGLDVDFEGKPPVILPNAAALTNDVHSLAHLPPLSVKITLPDGYPATTAPRVSVTVSPRWLPLNTIAALQKKCEELWQDYGKEQVVFTYIDYVQQAAGDAFGVADNAEHSLNLSSDLKLILLDYDLKCRRESFERETFDCGICLDPKKGRVCHRLLLCGHVFCVACLQDFYNSCIEQGDVDNVKCLDPDCGKALGKDLPPGKRRKLDRTLNPSELLQIPVEQEVVQRYVHLKRKKKLESDKNTVYCPRQWCQGAARSSKHPKSDDPFGDAELSESELEEQPTKRKKKQNPEDVPMEERLCVCEDCKFAFCSVCKKGWHGQLAICNPRRQAELNAEEQASLDYLKRFSTPCPTCNAPAQKTHGCNHMICFKCKTHFCYLCSSYLMEDNPYRHFNDFKSACYMRLWELEAGDGADAGHAYHGGGRDLLPWDEDSDSDDDDITDDGDDHEDDEEDVEAAPPLPGDWEFDEDDSDDEPAPDQRRADRPVIEFVNFARDGAAQRVQVPARPEAVDPGPAARQHNRAHGQDANHAPGQGVVAAPGQGNNMDQALQRFLQLAMEDREDEWDSDDDDMLHAAAAPEPLHRMQRRR